MDVKDALSRHRMTRAFDGTSVDEDRLVGLCTDALRAPTAGHARGVTMAVLAGRAGVERYLSVATDVGWRQRSPRAQGLAAAGGCALVVCDPRDYAARYAVDDKAASGLDEVDRWPVPYWFGDAAFATMALLLLAEEDGLASAFLGAFRNEAALLELAGAEGARLFGAVLVGRAADDQVRSASLDRPGPSRASRVRRVSG
jgi:nitroreductase